MSFINRNDGFASVEAELRTVNLHRTVLPLAPIQYQQQAPTWSTSRQSS